MSSSTIDAGPAGRTGSLPEARRATRWLLGGAVGLVAVCLLVLVAEGLSGLLVDVPPRDIFAAGDDALPYRLQPGLRRAYVFDSDRQVLTTDAAGRRSGDHTATPANAQQVFLLGDGIAFGVGLSDQDTVATRLQAALGAAYVVNNLAVPGYGPLDYLAQLERLPPEALAVVLFSEIDDLLAVGDGGPDRIVRCGYLVGGATLAARLPCWLLHARLLAALTDWTDPEPPPRLLPLGYRPNTRSGAQLLSFRLQTLLAPQAAARGHRLLVAAIPWAGAIRPDRGTRRRGPAAALPRHTEVAHGVDLLPPFAVTGDGAALFAHGFYLSPAGAALVGAQLAEAMQSLPGGGRSH